MTSRLVVACVLCLLLASSSWAAVACNNETSGNFTTANPAQLTYTPTAGSNRVVILAVHLQDTDADNIDITSVTSSAGGTWTLYGKQIQNAGAADVRTGVYWSTDFADGSQTFSVNLSSAALRGTLAAYTCTGVHTSFGADGPFRAAAAVNNGTATTATVDVTSTSATDLVIDAMTAATLNSGVNPVVGGGQTEMYNIQIGTDNADATGSTEPGNGGTVTMSWGTLTGIDGWATIAGALVEAPTASSFGPLRRRGY